MAEEKKVEKKDKDTEGEEQAAPPPTNKRKKMIILGAGGVVVLLLVAGVPLYLMHQKAKEQAAAHELTEDAASKLAADQAQMNGAGDEEELQEGEEPIGALLPLDTFVVNLNGGKYIRAQMQLEFVGRDIPKRFYSRMVPVRDALITLITAKEAGDLTSEKGKEKLRAEIKEIINEQMRREDIKHVYFTQFVIQ